MAGGESELRPFAGIELGGTKCVCTLAASHEQVLDQKIIATTTPEATLPAIEHVLGGWRRGSGIRALGIASFGPVDLDRTSPSYGAIKSTPKPGWSGTEIVGRLSRSAAAPAGFDTDVNGAALAEMRWGAGQGYADFAYITVGTGVGVGLIVDGKSARGFGHGELGHIRIVRAPGDEWPGTCPFHGACVEGLASGPAIETRLGTRELSDVGADDPFWDLVAHPLAQLCHVLACSTAPMRIAIGGGVIEHQPHLLNRIESLLVGSLAGYVDLPATPYVVAPALGGQAGPLGSIALAMDATCRREA
jgi:fructokinase